MVLGCVENFPALADRLLLRTWVKDDHPISYPFREKDHTNTLHSPSRHKAELSSSTGSFVIDPHLRLPAGLLRAVDSGSASASALRTRKNLVLEVENGSINVDIHPTPSMPSSRLRILSTTPSTIPDWTKPRRSTDKRYLHSDPAQVPPICGEQNMRTSYSQLGLMQDRKSPIHLLASILTTLPRIPQFCRRRRRLLMASHGVRSPVGGTPTTPTADLPSRNLNRLYTFTSHERFTVHYVASGNIDEHVRLSKELGSIAAILFIAEKKPIQIFL